MSEIKLNLIDSERILSGTIHGSVADSAVAALSAEPETIAELEAALARFIRPVTPYSLFALFRKRTELDDVPWDAGILIIDLAARIVASDSTYSQPSPKGVVKYHDGSQSTDVPIHYLLPEDWAFVYSVDQYLSICEQRKINRDANPPLDARSVLYGRPLLKWIVEVVDSSEGTALWRRLSSERARLDSVDPTIESPDPSVGPNSNEEDETNPISLIHARWLMTPRDDLRGQSPRDVLLSRMNFIDSDLESRAMQWSMGDEGPPCLSVDSFAYRFAGFGTHEWVIYYDLVRHLIWSALLCQRLSPGDIQKLKNGKCTEEVSEPEALMSNSGASQNGRTRQANDPNDTEIAIDQLEEIKTAWLERPQHDYDSRTPAILIGNERKRLPIAMLPRDMIVDENCPTCQMFADESALGLGVGFWHLDGSNMDDDFAFSSHRTVEEWEAERREWAEFSKQFNREWEEKQQKIARGEVVESDLGFAAGDPF